jgi:hypothetical protein
MIQPIGGSCPQPMHYPPITARTLARSPARISIARRSPISAATARRRSSADVIAAAVLGAEEPLLPVVVLLVASPFFLREILSDPRTL